MYRCIYMKQEKYISVEGSCSFATTTHYVQNNSYSSFPQKRQNALALLLGPKRKMFDKVAMLFSA